MVFFELLLTGFYWLFIGKRSYFPGFVLLIFFGSLFGLFVFLHTHQSHLKRVISPPTPTPLNISHKPTHSLESYIQKYPSSRDVWLYYGLLSYANARTHEASQAVRKLLQIDPTHPQVVTFLQLTK